MHVEGLGVAEVVGSPHPVDELAAREHAPRVAQQQLEQLELLQRHRDLAAVDLDRVALHVHAHGADLEHVERLVVHLDAAAEHGADPRQQLARRVRLGDVVVGPELEAHDYVHLGVLGGEHDDRHALGRADLPAHLGAGEAGEHEVEQDQVGAVLVERGHRGGTVLDDVHLVSLALEQEGERLAERRLVLDEHDACHVGSPMSVPASAGVCDASGRRMVKVEPRPGRDQTRTSPP